MLEIPSTITNATSLKQFTNALARADLTSYLQYRVNFNSFYTVCFSVCLRCGVTLAVFLCPVIAVEYELILSPTLYLVCARCSKVLNK